MKCDIFTHAEKELILSKAQFLPMGFKTLAVLWPAKHLNENVNFNFLKRVLPNNTFVITTK